MKKSLLLVAFLCISSVMFAQQAAAVASEKDGCTEAEMLEVAGKLVKYGYQTKTALPLIQAIQLYSQFNITAGQETPQKEGVSSSATEKTNPVSYDLAQIKADATTYADGDKNLLALLKDTPERGAVGGCITRIDQVSARCIDTWTITFRGGEPAYVVVCGDGDTDLDLYIYDENGNFIVSDTAYGDDCAVSFSPRWTGKFYVKIKNLGGVYNKYVLATN